MSPAAMIARKSAMIAAASRKICAPGPHHLDGDHAAPVDAAVDLPRPAAATFGAQLAEEVRAVVVGGGRAPGRDAATATPRR